MFYGYSIDQWVGLLEYFCIVFLAGVFIFCISAYLGNYIMKKELNNNKLYASRKRKNKKKQIFFDVA